MRLLRNLSLLSVSLLAFHGCATVQKRIALKDCRFSLQGASLKSVDLSGFSMDILLSVENPNTIDAVLDRFVGSVLVEGVKVADVSNTYGRTIKAGGKAKVPITVSVRYSYLKGAASRVMGVIKARRARIGVDGKAYVDFNVPILGKRSVPYPVRLSRTLTF